jgi:hypothetical protein
MKMIEPARRLSPRDPRSWFMSGVLAIAAIMDEKYAAAVTWPKGVRPNL